MKDKENWDKVQINEDHNTWLDCSDKVQINEDHNTWLDCSV